MFHEFFLLEETVKCTVRAGYMVGVVLHAFDDVLLKPTAPYHVLFVEGTQNESLPTNFVYKLRVWTVVY